MIYATFWFGPGPETLRAVVAALFALPEDLCPTRRSESEVGVGRPIGDFDRFLESLWSIRPLPILKRKGVHYVIMAPDGRPIRCSCQLNVDPSRAEELVERMAARNPVFGYACAWEELLHRNQVKTKVRFFGGDIGTSESFAGRDPAKIIPGLYWLTLVPNPLANRHGVPLSALVEQAVEHKRLGDGRHLLRFHERPEAWRERQPELDAVCTEQPGVFDIGAVRAEIAKHADPIDHRELDRILDPWP